MELTKDEVIYIHWYTEFEECSYLVKFHEKKLTKFSKANCLKQRCKSLVEYINVHLCMGRVCRVTFFINERDNFRALSACRLRMQNLGVLLQNSIKYKTTVCITTYVLVMNEVANCGETGNSHTGTLLSANFYKLHS